VTNWDKSYEKGTNR